MMKTLARAMGLRLAVIRIGGCLGLFLGPGLALAAPPEATVMFLRDGTLYRRALSKPAAVAVPTALADIRSITLSADEATLLVQSADRAYAIERPGWRAKVLACWGRPSVAASGRWISCAGSPGYTWMWDRKLRRRYALPHTRTDAAAAARPLGDSGELLLTSSAGLLAANASESRLLAPHRPDSHLLAAPNGKRAVGVYSDGASASAKSAKNAEPATHLYSFRLDGKAARRRLMSGAVPIVWSRDSGWLLVQRGNRACIVRATGGEYKCWRRYRGTAIAPDGTWALLLRKSETSKHKGRYDIYRAELAGADRSRPVLIERDVDGPALWLTATSPWSL